MITILPSATSVHEKLRDLFDKRTRGQRRVALVAYIGRDADKLLPDFRDVEVYCWPQTGATDPYTLDELQRPPHDAKVRLVDHLHMKLYWVEREGFVITSANLSRRALGDTIQEEVGIFCNDPSQVPIDTIIGRLKSRPLQQAELRRLQQLHDEYWANVPRRKLNAPARRVLGFSEWYESGRSPQWKTGWFDADGDESPSTARAARDMHGVGTIEDFIPCSPGQLAANDWVLCFRLDEDDRVSDPSWLRVDFIKNLTRSEVRIGGYRQEAVQLRPLGSEHRPPFRIELPPLRKTVAAFGADRIRAARRLQPSGQFLELLMQETLAHVGRRRRKADA